MATLYVENVPDDLYDALRRQAKQNRRSIAAEVLSLLETNVPTKEELKSRREFLSYVKGIQRRNRSRRSFPSTEEMLREDRAR
jgi:plasmid stability protein